MEGAAWLEKGVLGVVAMVVVVVVVARVGRGVTVAAAASTAAPPAAGGWVAAAVLAAESAPATAEESLGWGHRSSVTNGAQGSFLGGGVGAIGAEEGSREFNVPAKQLLGPKAPFRASRALFTGAQGLP